MDIKQSLSLPELDGFKVSEGWLDKRKLSHGLKGKQTSDESLCFSEFTVKTWMERIKELCKGYDQRISETWMKVVVFSKRCLQSV